MPSSKPNHAPSVQEHQIWLEAHYALGRLEAAQGTILDWRGRSAFIKSYIAEHTQVSAPNSEIESTKNNNQPPLTEEREHG